MGRWDRWGREGHHLQIPNHPRSLERLYAVRFEHAALVRLSLVLEPRSKLEAVGCYMARSHLTLPVLILGDLLQACKALKPRLLERLPYNSRLFELCNMLSGEILVAVCMPLHLLPLPNPETVLRYVRRRHETPACRIDKEVAGSNLKHPVMHGDPKLHGEQWEV